MTAAEDWTLVNQVYADPSPLAVNHRQQIMAAISKCADDMGGEVHASWIRPMLPDGVNEHLVGNVMSQLSRIGILTRTGRYLPSNDATNRNTTRDLPVRQVADWARLLEEVNR